MTRFRSLEVLKEHGLVRFLSMWFNLARAGMARRLLHKPYARHWEPLRDLYAGSRAFLIGNGPSLNKTPLYLLANEHTLCFNRFNIFLERLAWTPTMYMVVDGIVARNMAHEINQMTKVVEHAFFTRYSLTTSIDFRRFLVDRPNVHWMLPRGIHTPFNSGLPTVNPGGSVALAGLQVLAYLGFKEVILIGVDMDYKRHQTVTDVSGGGVRSTGDDDPNHFDPRYFGTGREYHQPTAAVVDSIMSSFERISREIVPTGCHVYNATIGGRLECFPRVDLRNLLVKSHEEEVRRFRAAFAATTGLQFEAEKERVDMKIGTQRMIAIEQSEVNRLVGQLIHTHVPVGPLDGWVYFVSRNAIRRVDVGKSLQDGQ